MRLRPVLLALLLLGLLAVAAYVATADPSPTLDPPRAAPPLVTAPAPEPAAPVAPQPSVPDAEPPPFPADAPRVLYGTISNPEGAPVAGATVRVVARGDRPQVQRTRSDASGQYRLDRVPPTAERLEVSARGYAPREFEKPSFPDEPKVRWDVVLESAAGVHGVVLVDGQPADGAWVFLRRGKERRARGAIHADGSGRFALPWPEGPGGVKVHATHGAHGRTMVEVDTPGEVTLILPGGGFISGRVVDQDGDAVPEFSVTASPFTRRTGGPPAQSFDDRHGRFRLGPIAPGKIRIWAAAEGFQPASLAGLRVVAGETLSGVVLKLKRSAVLVGRVTDASSGRGIDGALVVPAEWRSGALAETVGALSDATGRYRLTALPAKRTSIRVTAEGYRPLLVGGIQGPPGKEVRRDFAMTPQRRGAVPGQELTGIGAVLKKHRHGVEIGDLVEGGPAASDLENGDVVVMVGGVSARKGDIGRVAQAIRGEEGTDVVLWVKRQGRGEPERVVITRARVMMPDKHHRRRTR